MEKRTANISTNISANIMLYRRSDDATCDFIRKNLVTDTEFSVIGSLDGMTDAEIASLEAENPAYGVPVYLSDGQTIYADHHKLDETALNLAQRLQQQDSAPLVMFCTIPWPRLAGLRNIIRPSEIMEGLAAAATPTGGTIGVVQPDAITAEAELVHWTELPYQIISACADAGEGNEAIFTAAVKDLIERGSDAIVLDCLGYTRSHLELVRQMTDKPVIFPLDIIGKSLDSLFG